MGSPKPAQVSLDKGKHKNQWALKTCGVAEGEDQIQTEHSTSPDVLVTQWKFPSISLPAELKKYFCIGFLQWSCCKDG